MHPKMMSCQRHPKQSTFRKPTNLSTPCAEICTVSSPCPSSSSNVSRMLLQFSFFSAAHIEKIVRLASRGQKAGQSDSFAKKATKSKGAYIRGKWQGRSQVCSLWSVGNLEALGRSLSRKKFFGLWHRSACKPFE